MFDPPIGIDPSSPEVRAQILVEVVRTIATTPGRLDYGAVFEAVRKAVDICEEQCSMEIMSAASLLTRSGLVLSNGHNPIANTIDYGASTWLVAGPGLTRHVWADEVFYFDSGEGEEEDAA